MFDYDWRSKYSSTIYGFSNEENRWTYANAGGTPDIYSKLQVAVDVQEVFNEENPTYEPQQLKRYIDELEKRIKKYPTKLSIELTETIESAISRGKKLVQLNQEFNVDAVIVLQADKQFKGLEMWDALQSLGLKWGDGDLFHWGNDKDYGHDQHFSVWTTTEPGYFFPEEIKDGNMNPQNLVFGFSIPRSADPKNIFEIMLNSVKYCQKRLGGQILDRNMKPLDEEKEKLELSEFLKRMEQKGLKAGSNKALRMF
jgi:cell division protein ZipA